MVAAVTVVGVLTTAVVTLIGILLKQSIDLRTTQLAEQAAQRALVDQRRLTMDTALQTVRLLGNHHDETGTVQASAALMVLAKLGELRLAIDLAAELWPLGRISSSVAVQLVEAGLVSDDHTTQLDSAMLLRNNTGRLYVSETQYEWPRSLDSWPAGLPCDVRRALARALQEWFQAKPASATDWRWRLVEEARADTDPGVTRIARLLADAG